MKYQIYSIYDSKAQVFEQPFFARAKGEAIRTFSDLSNDRNTMVGKYPADYTLFHVGEFDNNSGVIDRLKTPVSIGLAQEFITQTTLTDPNQAVIPFANQVL